MSQDKKKKIIMSVDAETDGLWGRPFAIAAVCYDEDGKEVSRFCARSNEQVQNEWVKENSLPYCIDMPCVGGYEDLLRQFANYYNKMNQCHSVTTLWYGGHIVEAYLFREMMSRDLIGFFDAPYLPIDVSTILIVKNEDASSVEAYIKRQGGRLPEGHVDNPLYDAMIAYKAYRMLTLPKEPEYVPFPMRAFMKIDP